MVDRRGIAETGRSRAVDEVVETFATLPAKVRQALESFYVAGFSIREIAARYGCPTGTIKRRLSNARDRVRDLLGIDHQRRDSEMVERKVKKVFPAERPSIVVERLESEAAELDMRELTWWFAVPSLGEHVDWAEYQPVDGGSSRRLTRTVAMSAHRRAVIHRRVCIEIDLDQQWLAWRASLRRRQRTGTPRSGAG